MDFVKAVLFLISALVMLACVIFIPESAGTVSITFVGVLSIYLGTDVASMISATAKMKVGEFKELKKHKYVISLICLCVLIIVSLITQDGNTLSTTITSFISSIMVVLGCLLGGLEGNKIATKKGEPR